LILPAPHRMRQLFEFARIFPAWLSPCSKRRSFLTND
jgi:hypothetical protein